MNSPLDFLSQPENIQHEAPPSRLEEYFGKLPLSIYIIILNSLYYLLMLMLEGSEGMWKLGGLHFALITEGEYYRFITAYFLHANELHILMNMFSLFMVGPFIEGIFGKLNFFVLYMVTGLVSALSSYFISSEIMSVGASGAIYGIVGGFTIFLIIYKNELKMDVRRRLLINLFIVIGLNLSIGLIFSGLRWDNAGHIGGLLSGVLIGYFLKPGIFGRRKQPIITWVSLLFLVGMLASFAWSTWNYIFNISTSRSIMDYFEKNYSIHKRG